MLCVSLLPFPFSIGPPSQIDDPSGRFAVNLLQELARAFLAAADTRGQDCCAFAIQEVLLVFQCASADETRWGGEGGGV